MLRRSFIAASTGGAALLALPGSGPRRHVGTSDVARLRDGLEQLVALDDRRGGHTTLESAALAGARHALELQQGSASQVVRMRLYAVAADYTATAAWSCIDSRQLDRATQYLERTLTLAGLGRDTVTQLRAYNFLSMIGYQRQRWVDAVAAAQAAQAAGATRRDPLLGSLAHARAAIGHAATGDRQAALRSLGHARDTLGRADDRPRPAWTSFYGPAELAALAAVVHHHLGEVEEAEGESHRALAGIPPQFRRNRASATTRLALSQLAQRDIEQATATAADAYAQMQGDPLPGRLRTLLGDFHRTLITLAPGSAAAREWTDRVRTRGVTQ
jgi:tetratricopeptide (TPR) repeat protein